MEIAPFLFDIWVKFIYELKMKMKILDMSVVSAGSDVNVIVSLK